MHYYILTLLDFVIFSSAFALPFAILSSTTNSKHDINSNVVSQAPNIPQPVVKINLDTIANDGAASTDKPIRQEIAVELELSAALPPASGLQKPASSSSPWSSIQLFYYGSKPLDQSVDVVRAAITEGPQDVKCKLYNYLISDENSGYEAMVLSESNALDFKKEPFKKVSAIDCVAERMAAEEEKGGTLEEED